MRFILWLAALALSAALARGITPPDATAGHGAEALAVFLAYSVGHDPSYFAEDATFHVMAEEEPVVGREAIAETLDHFYNDAFSAAVGVSRNLLVSGNVVVLEAIFHGINTSDFMGMPATGRQVSVPMMMIYEIEGGLIQRLRLYMDFATMLRQLGHLE